MDSGTDPQAVEHPARVGTGTAVTCVLLAAAAIFQVVLSWAVGDPSAAAVSLLPLAMVGVALLTVLPRRSSPRG